ncbi:MAG: PilN domain-containing protein [Pseudomonadota bacterium]|nr:PilN domain-containing protein [Pseudomonadota bacterium]
MTRLNLLPWRQMRRKEQDRQLLSVGIGAAILMLLILFYVYVNVNSRIHEQNLRNQYLTTQINKLDAQIRAIRQLKKERQALVARMQVIQQLEADRTQIVHVFDSLARRLPAGIYLTRLVQRGALISLSGVAQSNARVSALMRSLDASNWFAKPDLDVINVSAKGNVRVSNFKLHVTETNKAAKKKKGSKS